MTTGSSMFEFEELDRFEITGRGTVVCVSNPHDPDLWNPGTLMGQEVRVNGKIVKVRGVETFAIFRSKESPYTHDFAILI